MMKEEFVQLWKSMTKTKKDLELTDEDYKVIEYVYANHPLFDSKEKAVQAYILFGVDIFRALRRQAGQFHDAYEDMRAAAVVADHKRNLYNQMVSDMGGVWQG